ncbi:NAD-dependent epimerase/dehydratase family protein [Jatrophihabitans telluris]|uniref:NAD-dependent epimerase/dehydratase family protein n=1 Tax=Jatrophihabitans telluris TaxID=2038343 RepID=A0ABY4QZ56_9ACTN|nr:NAD-dependent epimerase/dehydratase family protein [Jatrophihabitans telluris]UQX88864.1 NAD-dependent epimerase/dehydratase family protein [Jatrophihabitans telluris]
MASVVLVTGVSRYLGGRLAGRLAADPAIDRVIGVDTVAPPRADLDLLGRTEFVRADIRNPLISRVISQAGVDTVVHASVTATPHGAGGRTPMKEMNVIGTMQLLAACQKSDTVERLVVKSTTAVYGTSSRDPAIFTEDMSAKSLPGSGYAKDAVEVEGYVRGFIRRRPDIGVTLLRFANFIGPFIDTPLTRYFQLPLLPTALGFDPRLQLLHESDAIEVLRLAATSARPGTFNVSGDGALLLSQAIRRAGRISLPVPSPAVSFVGRTVRRSGLVDFSPEQMQFLNFGRVVCNARLKKGFGYIPAYTTSEAFDSFLTGRPVEPVVSPRLVAAGESMISRLLRLHPEPLSTARVVRHG